jgi:ABC-type glycerol-3-phosphate transport system permease component
MRAEPLAPPHTRATPRQQRRARWLRGNRLYALVVSLILIPICVLWIYPFLWLVSAAFKTNQEIFAGLNLIPTTWHWENFSRAWTQANIGTYFTNTVIITLTTVTIVVVTTSMMGYVIGRYSFPGKRVIMALFLATIFVPEGYTIIPLFDIVNRLGLNNSLLGVILAESGAVHIIFILLFAGYFGQLPRELEEAAIMDGAGFNRLFFQVILPLAQPVVATTVILQFMASWNSFFLPLVLTLSRPQLRTLGVGMFAFQGEYFSDWAGMAAAATISLFPIIIVFLLLQRYFVEGLAGAIKQ